MEDDIFRYLNSEMSPSEESEFRQRMSEDAELREHVENMSLLKASFQASDIEVDIIRKRKNSAILRWCGIAASILIIVSCSLFLDAKHYNYYQADLCLQKVELINESEEGAMLRGTDRVSNAITLYNRGDIDAALQILNDLIDNPGLHNPSDAYFIKGVILLREHGVDSEAVRCLEKSDNPQAKELLESLKLTFLF